jgi:hypothetical protein
MKKKRKQSIKDVIRRWKLLDRELKDPEGVSLLEFAKRKPVDVDVKTLRRDLKALKELGYEAFSRRLSDEQECYWAYRRGQRPLFTENSDYWADFWRKVREEKQRRQEQSRSEVDGGADVPADPK